MQLNTSKILNKKGLSLILKYRGRTGGFVVSCYVLKESFMIRSENQTEIM